MPGLGKGAKGLGVAVKRRHRRICRDSIQSIAKPSLRRVARRGGVKRFNGCIYPYAREALRTYLAGVLRDSVSYADHVNRATITGADVVLAVKRSGTTLYGFGV